MSILKIKDSQGNWVGVPTVKGDTGNGISSAILNDDYTLTLTFTDGTTYKTPSIRGEKGEKGEPATDMEIHICSITEYDAETRIPTIANPNDKTFYLVPTEDGTSPDLFTEWVYVNNAWEMFGSASIDLSGYLTDVTVNGTSVVTDGVANVPIASANKVGVVKINAEKGIVINGNQELLINYSDDILVKNGTENYKPIVPSKQHVSTFYGLAKAAGVDMSTSSNAVGTYTDEAKTAIKQMLGLHDTIDSFVEEVTGTDVTITGQPSYRYNCGEVLSLSITPPQSGTIDVRFTSGSTPTVLTLPQTVKMPEWWVEVEANTIYEMCITDGIYCGVMTWAI